MTNSTRNRKPGDWRQAANENAAQHNSQDGSSRGFRQQRQNAASRRSTSQAPSRNDETAASAQSGHGILSPASTTIYPKCLTQDFLDDVGVAFVDARGNRIRYPYHSQYPPIRIIPVDEVDVQSTGMSDLRNLNGPDHSNGAHARRSQGTSSNLRSLVSEVSLANAEHHHPNSKADDPSEYYSFPAFEALTASSASSTTQSDRLAVLPEASSEEQAVGCSSNLNWNTTFVSDGDTSLDAWITQNPQASAQEGGISFQELMAMDTSFDFISSLELSPGTHFQF